tara:strand:- start:73 stop:417 length:345 start_codon:yes stop_codon:yes gene_type:complete
MRAHVVKDGVVTSTIIVNSLSDFPDLIDGTEGAIGWTWDGSTLSNPNASTTSEITVLKADGGRVKRDSLLAETDWMASSDLTMSDDWKTYRQALRDIPTQSGFPETITWPTKPS